MSRNALSASAARPAASLGGPALTAALPELAAQLAGRRTLVLSGAGISTDSGIPDYRSPERLAKPRHPMRYQQFVASEGARQRYWARSAVGWPRVAAAQPNAAHRALARLEARGVMGVITQNVDGLHQAAGSRRVLELHGSLAAVRCLTCRRVSSRRQLQTRLLALNPELALAARAASASAPDGDAEIPEALWACVRVPACTHCGGVLKPDVVFFGENVPAPRVARAYAMLERAEALLVVGSSLTVFSGYRFVVRAVQTGRPVYILNRGPTRGDDAAALKLEAPLGEALPKLAALLAA
ncbi:NAD-dependent protein deacetylase [Truepera radiovictrix]|uniref:NAD-dependent protein deacetylase n=1 Tax=Truepera radiovictrix (strain DSM 17093 / CIP 108686 / LMG 22925 / RQ-24) TaxID=649638 RepID=D7CUE9_TRURR|nr:NAD-dependent protein deacetylase [Truepera radiovictrix]ADI15734.1 Silent information regulator protein Sir2 [Truepera radiovictrix DSM 17093]WMT58640.1 NAD-dependent protein deacetylase [Truepera radiovictrix]